MPTRRRVVAQGGKAKRNLLVGLLAAIATVIAVVLCLSLISGGDGESCDTKGSGSVEVPVFLRVDFDGYESENASPLSLHMEGAYGDGAEYSADILAEQGVSEPLWLMPGVYRVTGNTIPVMNDGFIFVDAIDQEFHVESEAIDILESKMDSDAARVLSLSLREKKGPIEITDEQLEEIRTKFVAFGIDEKYVDVIVDLQQEIEKSGERQSLTEDAIGIEEAAFAPPQASSIVGSYIKEWPVDGAEYNPSYSVYVESVEGRTVRFSVSYVATNLRYIVGTDAPGYGLISAQLDESNILHFSYEEDSRGGKGMGTIEFGNDYLIVNVMPTFTEKGEEGKTLETNGPLTLYKASSDSSGAIHVSGSH